MSRLVDTIYDAFTGTTKRWYVDDEKDELTCKQEADYSSLVSHNRAISNDNFSFDSKTKFHKMASIPPIIEMELLKKGINIHEDCPAMRKRLYREIEVNYPYLKTHQKKMWRPV